MSYVSFTWRIGWNCLLVFMCKNSFVKIIIENKIILFHLETKLHVSVIYSCITNYPQASDLQ